MSAANADASDSLALLHLAPRPGEVAHNKRMVEDAVRRASAMGAKLIVTPELVVSGYGFRDIIGTDWIAPRPGGAVRLGRRSLRGRHRPSCCWARPRRRRHGKAVQQHDPVCSRRRRLGHHRKIKVLKVGSESWSVPGDRATVLTIDGIGRVGLFVCADMYSQAAGRRDRIPGRRSSGFVRGLGAGSSRPERRMGMGLARRPGGRCWFAIARASTCMDFKALRDRSPRSTATIASSHNSPDSAIVLVDWNPQARQLSNWRVVLMASGPGAALLALGVPARQRVRLGASAAACRHRQSLPRPARPAPCRAGATGRASATSSHDPRISVLADRARAIPAVRAKVESILELRPDLVIFDAMRTPTSSAWCARRACRSSRCRGRHRSRRPRR